MTYVISDLHGNDKRFTDILSQINLQSDDTLYIIGDVIDRGPGGVAMLEHIKNQENMVLLAGNHEDMMLQALGARPAIRSDMMDIWMNNGGAFTLNVFEELNPERQQDLLDWLNQLPEYLDITVNNQRYMLVHASPATTRFARLWERINPIFFRPVPGKVIIFGHTPCCYMHPVLDRYFRNCGGHIRIEKNKDWIDIDCGCGLSHIRQACLGCLRLDDMQEYYSTI